MPFDGLEDQYDILRGIARRLLGGGHGAGLPDPTEIVHECFLRMCRAVEEQQIEPARFRAYSAVTMRSVLVDWVRREGRLQRGGGRVRVTLNDEVHLVDRAERLDLIDLNEALDKLAVDHATAARVIELRYFGGLDGNEIAEQLGVTRRTVTNHWQFGRSWLSRELGRGEVG